MTPYCYLNGKIIPVSDATVSIYDIGLLRGYGIYEALTTKNRKPFALSEHLTRFRDSAKFLGIDIKESDNEISEAIKILIEKNGFKETNIKFIITGGLTKNSIEFDRSTPTFYILAEEFIPLPEIVFVEGASLTTYEHLRQFPSYKTINYIQGVLVQNLRKENHAIEILYTSQGNALEAATSNFFIVKNKTLITPVNNILKGITRKKVLEIAKPHFTIEEREMSLDETLRADEAFITSSFKDIVPIVSIDNQKIGGGEVGEITKKLMKVFEDFTKNY